MQGTRVHDVTTDLTGIQALVVGLGRSGVAAAEFLRTKGARVTGTDVKTEAELGHSVARLRSLGVRLDLGEHSVHSFVTSDLIVLSPGVDPRLSLLRDARARQIPVVSEIELAYWYLQQPLIAVTGTNGKSTTSALIGHLLSHGGSDVFVGGNIGTPLTSFFLQGARADYVVAEISSFQLESVNEFTPWIAVLLNLDEDHLERHPTFSEYVDVKARIFSNQGPEDWAVINTDDPTVKGLLPRLKSHVFSFGTRNTGGPGVWPEAGELVSTLNGDYRHRVSVHDVRLVGRHNVENMMAAVGTAAICGMSTRHIQEGLTTFPGLEHRLEYVGTWRQISVYNDSKATNVSATIRALASFDRPVILVAGGRDKGGDYGPLKPLIQEKVKALILVGEAAERMRSAFEDVASPQLAEDLEDAVRLCWQLARPGDVMLLSPACSSFDMFRDYEERGRVFKRIVRESARNPL
jgi:UDP-N-acetylmuramoylalanine--D-glutamate ligase